MPRNYILALDQGTTSSRAILFKRDGTVAGMAQAEFTQHFPQDGWVEHDANEIWSTQSGVAIGVLSRKGLDADDLVAIGITNQRETVVLWSRKTGRPIHNAIVWQDRRTAELCARLKSEGLEERFREKTGLFLDPYFSGTKLKWLLDNVPGARDMAYRGELAFGTIDSWLLWNLTRGHIHRTDTTNASRTLLFNINEGHWDEELLALLDIPESVLPEVHPSSFIFGEASRAGLEGVPIAGIAGDQQAALFGQACFEADQAKNTYGTGCFLLRPTGEKAVHSEHNLLSTLACSTGPQLEYALEGSVFIGGAVVQWLRDELGLIKCAADSQQIASSVPDTSGVTIVPAFSGLGAPHWDPHARGTICGISRGTRSAHIVRAALESIAFQSADLLDAFNADFGEALSELRVDGGASQNDFLMQFQANIMQVPVIRPKVTETTALGAAYLAGLATEFWPSRDQLSQQWKVDRVFEPMISTARAAELRARWQRALSAAKAWSNG